MIMYSGNRFDSVEPSLVFHGISELHLDQTLLPWDEVSFPEGIHK
jgi:tubulin-specific chaperone E